MSSGIINDKESTKWMNPQSPKISILLSLGLSFFVLMWCFILAIFSGSLGFLAFAIISLIYFISKIFFLGAVKRSISAPIEFQNYGSGKHWSLSVLISIILLATNSAFITFLIINDFNKHLNIDYFSYGIVMSLVSTIIAFLVSKYQRRSFKKNNFEMLKYDSSDSKEYFQFLLILTIILSVSLLLFKYKNFEPAMIDSTIAISFSFGIAINSLKNILEAVNQLLDKPVSEEIQFNILAAVSENINLMCEFQSIHTRKSGGDVFIEMDVVLPHDYTLKQAYELEHKIRNSIREKHPEANLRLYIKPCLIDCHYGSTKNCPIGME